MANEKNQKEQNFPVKKNIIAVVACIAVVFGLAVLMSGTDEPKAVKPTPVAADVKQPANIKAKENAARVEAKKQPIVINENMARIDISTALAEDKKPQFMVYVNGSEKPLKRAFWMYRKGLYGSTIQKDGEKLDIVIKVLKDADIKLSASGIQKLDKKKNKVPVWVEYTKFSINDENILKSAKKVWFEEPLEHELKAKAGQEYKIHAEWHKDSKKK